MGKRVLLGMSGGVDSSTSAVLLKNAGYEVIGCTMRLWESEEVESSNFVNSAVLDAKKVCDKLGIQHYILDSKEEFKCKVIDKFIREYENANTPNPCVECNKYFKFGVFYQKALELKCDYIATGHYARTEFSEKYNQYVLRKSNIEKKDQTYFLYAMSKNEIEHIIFPLQDYMSKDDIRKIAQDNDLEVAKKKDSQEICFIPDGDYKSFLYNNIKTNIKPGNIVLKSGEILGKHNGLINYTIGQRKGIGIAFEEPLYVIKLDVKNNEVIVGREKDLYNDYLEADELNWLIDVDNEFNCYAKIRYRAKEAEAKVKIEKNNAKVIFKEPQRAITSGQSVVFYDEDGIVLGGGKIK